MDQNNNTMPEGHTPNDGHNHSVEATSSPLTQNNVQASGSDAIGEHKLFAILGYILPILFFVPMVQESSKNNVFARYHANQQLNLLGVCIGVYILGRVLLSISYMLFTLVPLLNLVLLVLVIMGIIHAAQGQMKELPVIGKYNFLDKLFAR